MFSPKNEETIETDISNKSKNETDIEILNKVQNLKQNRCWLCFKILSSQYLESTVSQSGPNSTEVI